jgi:phosphate transport system substrate-binding protein
MLSITKYNLKFGRIASKAAIGSILIGSILVGPSGYGISPAAETTATAAIKKTVVKKAVTKKTTVKKKVVAPKKPAVPKKPAAPPKKASNKNNPANSMSGSVKISTTAAMKPLAQDLVKAFNKKYGKVTVSVFGGQAGIGIQNVSSNKSDIGIASSELSKDDISKGLSATKIGADVIAIVVNSSNKVRNLSTSDVFNIYTRTIQNWKELRGYDGQIAFNTYLSSVGLSNLFDSVFMHGQRFSDKVVIHSTTASMLNTVIRNKNAIGYASMSDVKRGIRALSINGVAPTAANARSGRYPFSRNINMVTKGTKSAATNAFIQFTISAEGQKIIQKYYSPLK